MKERIYFCRLTEIFVILFLFYSLWVKPVMAISNISILDSFFSPIAFSCCCFSSVVFSLPWHHIKLWIMEMFIDGIEKSLGSLLGICFSRTIEQECWEFYCFIWHCLWIFDVWMEGEARTISSGVIDSILKQRRKLLLITWANILEIDISILIDATLKLLLFSSV